MNTHDEYTYLINMAKSRKIILENGEKHHIVPKCVRPSKRGQSAIYRKGKYLKSFKGIAKASRELGLIRQNINRVLSGNRPQVKGMVFEYE